MRKLYLFMIVAFAAFQSFAQTIPNPELLYYKFNEIGTVVTNYALTPPVGTNVATIMGGVTQGGSGQCDGALIGTGVSSTADYLNTGWATDLTGTAWTISFWTNNIQPSATLFYIFGDVNATSFRCFTNGVAGPNNWILRGPIGDISAPGGAVPGPSMTTFLYDPVAGNTRAYVNGVLVSTVVQAPPTIASAGPFKVMGYSANVGSPAGGLLDEFRVYNRALTDTEILDLFNRNTTSSFSVTSCGDYTAPSGAVFSASGVYNDTIPNMLCGDSVMTINLSVNQPSFDTIQTAVCDSYTAPSGVIFTTTGIYIDTITNVSGCDSIISIDLTVNYTTIDTLIISQCEMYDAPDGSQITTSGLYDFVLTNVAGCDSLIHVDLTILQPTSSSMTVTACDSYTAPDGAVYNQSGNYTAVLTNAVGCDSIISIALTINTVNNATSTSGFTISATQANATYQWIACGSNIPLNGETGQSFTAVVNGSYAVVVTNNGCTDTSACTVISTIGITDLADFGISISPNPTAGNISIENANQKENMYVLTDLTGKVYLRETTNAATLLWDLTAFPSGVFQITVTNETGVSTSKLVKL